MSNNFDVLSRGYSEVDNAFYRNTHSKVMQITEDKLKLSQRF